jgi:hypothetical protein
MIDLRTRLLPEDRDVWTMGTATSINNNGQIVVGDWQDTSADGGGGTNRAFLLTPTTTVPPAPTTPSTPDLDGSSDTGASDTDNLTNDDTPTFSGTADKGLTVKIYVDGAEKGSGTATTGGTYNITTSTLQPGNHSVTAKASNGSVESGAKPPLNITIDKTAPSVSTVSPTDIATNVLRNTNLTSTFSEKMDPASISKSSFKLYKCSSTTCTTTQQVTDVGVKLSTDGLTATLDPFPTSPKALLGSKTKYKAIVTTGANGAKDMAGNELDQSPSTSGNQQKEWTFTTGSS